MHIDTFKSIYRCLLRCSMSRHLVSYITGTQKRPHKNSPLNTGYWRIHPLFRQQNHHFGSISRREHTYLTAYVCHIQASHWFFRKLHGAPDRCPQIRPDIAKTVSSVPIKNFHEKRRSRLQIRTNGTSYPIRSRRSSHFAFNRYSRHVIWSIRTSLLLQADWWNLHPGYP